MLEVNHKNKTEAKLPSQKWLRNLTSHHTTCVKRLQKALIRSSG